MILLEPAVQPSLLHATPPLSPERFAALRRELALQGFKWDPQIEDTCTIAPFALAISGAAWRKLAAMARGLAAETVEAEAELLSRPELWSSLDLPRRLGAVLENSKQLTPGAGRIMRFDFHLTPRGWRVAEVNSDVPGGYTEATNLSRLFAAALGSRFTTAGDPAGAWARAIVRAAGGEPIGLLSAAGYMEDRQITAYLRQRLAELGAKACLVDLHNLAWENGRARLAAAHRAPIALGAIVRFYQGEWLADLPKRRGWPLLFAAEKRP